MSTPLDTLTRRAAEADAADPLARFRDLFHVPEGMIYLDGNSLGLMPRAVAERVQAAATQDWAEGLIRSWTDAGWFHLPMRVGDRIAPLIGARAGDVAVGDSTSVNLFKALAAALHLQPGRTEILAEGTVRHAGRSTGVADGTIRGAADGRLYATGSTTCIIMALA